MSALEDSGTGARAQAGQGRWVLLGALGLWTIVIPYLGLLVGLRLDVAAIVEVVDHVVPGLVVLAAVAVGLSARRGPGAASGDTTPMLAAALAFLAGFWVTATHVPLLAEASRGESPWDAAIWHNTGGLPIGALSLALLVGPLFRSGS